MIGISHGFDTVLLVLRYPNSDGHCSFPRNWVITDGRGSKTETLHHWFVRVVDGVFDGGFGEFAIEPGFALFVRAKLDKATMRIKYLNCQALVTPGKELIDFYRCDQVDAHYYRLDYDPSILGPFCAEPIPHLHVRMHGPPRAWVRDPNYLVQEFVEWVYLNYFHDIWTHWAGRTWEEYRRKQGIREEDDVFKTILSAFEEGQIDFVTENQTQLKQIRNAIRTARDRLFPYYCDPAHGELINY